MNTTDQYKTEAMRLLDSYPLEVCERVAKRLNSRGWNVNHFDCKVDIFEDVRWCAKAHIKTDLTKNTCEQKWKELSGIFADMELSVEMVSSGASFDTEAVQHRKYGSSGGHRLLIGKWYDFHVQFRPAKHLELSVLTEEEA